MLAPFLSAVFAVVSWMLRLSVSFLWAAPSAAFIASKKVYSVFQLSGLVLRQRNWALGELQGFFLVLNESQSLNKVLKQGIISYRNS